MVEVHGRDVGRRAGERGRLELQRGPRAVLVDAEGTQARPRHGDQLERGIRFVVEVEGPHEVDRAIEDNLLAPAVAPLQGYHDPAARARQEIRASVAVEVGRLELDDALERAEPEVGGFEGELARRLRHPRAARLRRRDATEGPDARGCRGELGDAGALQLFAPRAQLLGLVHAIVEHEQALEPVQRGDVPAPAVLDADLDDAAQESLRLLGLVEVVEHAPKDVARRQVTRGQVVGPPQVLDGVLEVAVLARDLPTQEPQRRRIRIERLDALQVAVRRSDVRQSELDRGGAQQVAHLGVLAGDERRERLARRLELILREPVRDALARQGRLDVEALGVRVTAAPTEEREREGRDEEETGEERMVDRLALHAKRLAYRPRSLVGPAVGIPPVSPPCAPGRAGAS